MGKPKGRSGSEARRLDCTVAFRVSRGDYADLWDKAREAGFNRVGLFVRAVALGGGNAEERQLRQLLAPLGKLHMHLVALDRQAEGQASGDMRDGLREIANGVEDLAQHVRRLVA